MFVNIGDVIFQFLIFTILLLLIFAIYFGIRCLVNRFSNNPQNDEIEEKLDKIIELLEKNELDKL